VDLLPYQLAIISKGNTMKYFKLLTLSAVVIGVIGCSAEDQDSSATNEQQPVAVSGVVIDPNISSAIVFADYDGDGVLDSFEPWVLTDEAGYFGSSEDGDDYCTTDLDHCLTLANSDAVPLVAVGGYDSVTLERVETRLSRTYSGTGVQVITPLTSLSTMTVSEDFDSSLNFMIDAFVEEESTTALEMAFTLHKMVEVLTGVLADEYSAIGEEELLPSDLSGFVYQAIDAVGSDQELALADFLEKYSENQIDLILEQAREYINNAYEDAGISLLAQYSVRKNVRSYVSSNVSEQDISDLLEQQQLLILTQFELAASNENIAELPKLQKGLLRLIQYVVNNAVSIIESNGDLSTAVLPIIELINANEDDTLLTAFGQDSYDSSYFDSELIAVVDDITDILTTMEQRQELPELMGSQMLALSEATATEDAKVTLYFDGELSGTLSACIYYQDFTDSSNINNTQGTLLSGEWTKDDYQLYITVKFAGASRSLRIKSGTGTSFVFDYDGEEETWDGSQSFEDIVGSRPTSDSDCQVNFM